MASIIAAPSQPLSGESGRAVGEFRGSIVCVLSHVSFSATLQPQLLSQGEVHPFRHLQGQLESSESFMIDG
jgi:hypothetical protein